MVQRLTIRYQLSAENQDKGVKVLPADSGKTPKPSIYQSFVLSLINANNHLYYYCS